MKKSMNGRRVVLTATACVGVALAGPACTQVRPAAVHTDARAAAMSLAQPAGRGRLAAAPVRLRTLSADQTRTALRDAAFGPDTVRYGVELYRLLYRTVDAGGRPTVASGLVVLPQGGERRLRLVSFTHGTQSYRDDAPSVGGDDFATAPPITFGAAGFAAAAPDYLGLGKGAGTHPWMDVPSETTASLDMLRAARQFMTEKGRTPQPRILVTGFSQGASAALGLARALQDGADPGFRLGAVAPISGAYAFRDAEIPALLASSQAGDKAGSEIDAKLAVAYTTYLLVSWNRLHHLYDSPRTVFAGAYADKVDKLFDGTTPGQKMLATLPDSLDRLLTPRGFDLLRHPSGAFARALSVSDATCTGWVPRVPVRLYYAAGDEQAVTANTGRCLAAFRASGAGPASVDLGAHDFFGSRHLGTAVGGTEAVVRWFTRLPG
jgi:hypothetical protein